MKAKTTILAAAVATVLSAGMSGQASASVYGRSYLAIDNLTIKISDNGGTTAGGAVVNNFSFNLSNSADLNGNFDGDAAACSGKPGAPAAGTNNCNPRANTGLNTANTVLDERAVNSATGAPVRANNNFSFFGPGANQYSNADSVIYTAQLTGGVPTSTEQIAESELQTGTSASAFAEIQSLTGFTFAFTVDGANQIEIDFLADNSRFVSISDLIADTAGAQANMDVEFRLEKVDGSASANWRPNGNTNTGAGVSGGLVATENFDDFDLQLDYGVSTLDNSCAGSGVVGGAPCPAGEVSGFTALAQQYGLLLTGLSDGDWTLTLAAKTSTSLSRTVPVPEPASLALVGVALAGLGLASRRRRQA